MALDKYSYKSDKVANLYRASFYLVKGYKNMALDFLRKLRDKFDGINLEDRKSQLFWAEKILDCYLELK